jgi:hypothetical protein
VAHREAQALSREAEVRHYVRCQRFQQQALVVGGCQGTNAGERTRCEVKIQRLCVFQQRIRFGYELVNDEKRCLLATNSQWLDMDIRTLFHLDSLRQDGAVAQ